MTPTQLHQQAVIAERRARGRTPGEQYALDMLRRARANPDATWPPELNIMTAFGAAMNAANRSGHSVVLTVERPA
jgi:hypothetical protein